MQAAAPDLALPAPSGVTALSLPLALAFAFGGGLLLNLMPCVFPILSLKALGLATSAADDARASRRDGVAFAAGVVLAFAALGIALAALRAAGDELGKSLLSLRRADVTAARQRPSSRAAEKPDEKAPAEPPSQSRRRRN